MAGDLRISMLIEANAQRARAEVASMREGVAQLAEAGRDAGGGMAAASDGAAEWGSMVQMLRASMQPMVAEANALAAAVDQLTIAEETGALSAREAALAHDLLARQAIELQARMEAAGVTLDGTTAAIRHHDTAIQQLIARNTGLSRSEDESIADHLRHGQALDQLRAKFDPLFASSRQYELALGEIAEAERLGAISATTAAAARERLAQSMAPAVTATDRFGRSNQQAAQYAGQLSYQLNDIGMMMAMGQSPFLLMMQQGPQVVQVFGQMRLAGVGLRTALVSAFGMLINPMSLATMAVIGFGAAAVQWFGQAEEAAETVADATQRLGEIEAGLRDTRAILDLSLSELIEKYGSYALAIRDAARAQEELRIAQARTALAEGIQNAEEDWGRFSARMDAALAVSQAKAFEDLMVSPDTSLAAALEKDTAHLSVAAEKTASAVRELQSVLKVSEADAIRLADAFAVVRDAASFDDRIAAMQALRDVMREAGVSLDSLPPAIQDALAEAGALTLEMAALKGEADGATSAMMALVASAPGGGWLAGAIGDASTLAGTLWDAALAAAAARQEAFNSGVDPASGKLYGGRGGDPRRFGASPGTSNTFDVENFKVPEVSSRAAGVGSGGGASEITKQADALKTLREAQERQIALLRTTDPIQRIILENHEALAGATEAEKAQVVGLIQERERLEAIGDRIEEIGQIGGRAFSSLATGASSFSDALSMVLESLAEMASSAVWDMFWQGTGDSGGLQGLIGDWLGLPAKAEGGRVIGPGGPRDDRILTRLSNGEYVVNAAATGQHLPLLEAINGGASLSDLLGGLAGGSPIALADGGYVGSLNGAYAPQDWGTARIGRPGDAGSNAAAAPIINIHNNSPEPIRQQTSTGPNGEAVVDMIVGRSISRGRYDKQLSTRHGLTPEIARR